MTVSVDLPQTIVVQVGQSEGVASHIIKGWLRPGVLALQDRVINRRVGRPRFADDKLLCDKGHRLSRDGLDVLQHITIHIRNQSDASEGQSHDSSTLYSKDY
jgi:hypothetical protein